jgi:hypothetical protein
MKLNIKDAVALLAVIASMLTAYWQHSEKMHEMELRLKYQHKADMQEHVLESILE